MYEAVFVIVTIVSSVFAYLGGRTSGIMKGRIEGASMYRQYILDETRKILKESENDIRE